MEPYQKLPVPSGYSDDGRPMYDMADMHDHADAAREPLEAEIQRLRAELVAEAARTAAEKLRADQMTEQHRMQAKLHQEAAQEVLRLRSRIDADGIRMPTWDELHSAWHRIGADLKGLKWDQFVTAARMVNTVAVQNTPDPNDFPLGKACDPSGEGSCEACQ